MKRIKFLWLLWQFIKRSFYGWFEKRKCPVGQSSCQNCPFFSRCDFHLLDDVKS